MTKYILPQIIQYRSTNPIIQHTLRPISLTRLPRSLSQDMSILTHTAAQNQLAALAANQIGQTHRMFAVLKSQYIVSGQWSEYQHARPQQYIIVVNPTLENESHARFKDHEECASIEGVLFAVWVALVQRYKYQAVVQSPALSFVQKKVEVEGFEARVWDHAKRHVDGVLPINERVSHLEFHMKDEYKVNPLFRAHFQFIKKEISMVNSTNIKDYLLSKEQMDARKKQNPLKEDMPEQISPQLRAQIQKLKRKMGNNQQ